MFETELIANASLIHVPDVRMPLPGVIFKFSVDDILDCNGLATSQHEFSFADLDYGIPCGKRRNCAKRRTLNIESGYCLLPEPLDGGNAVDHLGTRRQDTGAPVSP
jgi:hypothetical protein